MLRTVTVAAIVIQYVDAQKVGTLKMEKHPKLTTSTCSLQGGCTSAEKEVVIDSNWRWLHEVNQPNNCYSGNKWSEALCPDVQTCAKNCAIEGADAEYESTYGIKTSGNSLDLNFVTHGTYSSNVGSRTYLMKDENTYELFKLKNKEFTFDVDVSNMPCGLNGALYFVQMDADGGKAKYPSNEAGARMGTGYCDAQCPHDLKFINGEPNMLEWTPSATDVNSGKGKYGSCCVEMDIWEANMISTAYTAHACSADGQTRCEGVDCGDNPDHRFDGFCDKNGCDFQTYRLGNASFYGPSATFNIDTTKKITVVTQFVTADGTDTGALTEIRRFYKQGSTIIPTPTMAVGGKGSYNSLSTEYCQAEVDYFADGTNFLAKGGLSSMDKAFEEGMVLVMSIWDDHDVNMLWLDSTYPVDGKKPGSHRGTCDVTSGNPKDVERAQPNSHVTYSNIRFGDIGSTVKGLPTPSPAPAPSPAPSPAPAPSPSPTPTPTPTPSGCPGESLAACIHVCPSTPTVAFEVCVDECISRCSSLVATSLIAATATKSCKPWDHCISDACCPMGWECTQHASKATFNQCTPVAALAAAFVKTRPSREMLTGFFVNGTTLFGPAGLAEY